MRVGFFFWPYTPDYTVRMARLGEELGFDLIGIADTPGNAMDVWLALGLAAAATTRVRLATCVTNLVTRHPAITAMAAASLDLAAPGRLLLGLGAGHSGVANLGAAPIRSSELAAGIDFARRLLAGERASLHGVATQLPWGQRAVPVYGAASGPKAIAAVAAVADGIFVNYGLGAEHVARVESATRSGSLRLGSRSAEAAPAATPCDTTPARRLDASPEEAGNAATSEFDVWYVACLDCDERRDRALEKLGNILGFVAAYVLGPDPEGRGVPQDLVPAIRALRATYATRQREMDPDLVKRLGLFDYLRARLAVAGTPDDCLRQARAAIAAGASRLMFTVSLAADPLRAVELFGRSVLPGLRT
jgi:alkanesulfonate monooxygenase SsuD/methylene tetrahydromethanopterin reductase-like flavin-dependent oxidoreductase (luciferase family)